MYSAENGRVGEVSNKFCWSHLLGENPTYWNSPGASSSSMCHVWGGSHVSLWFSLMETKCKQSDFTLQQQLNNVSLKNHMSFPWSNQTHFVELPKSRSVTVVWRKGWLWPHIARLVTRQHSHPIYFHPRSSHTDMLSCTPRTLSWWKICPCNHRLLG